MVAGLAALVAVGAPLLFSASLEEKEKEQPAGVHKTKQSKPLI